jgi:hypothetical protein
VCVCVCVCVDVWLLLRGKLLVTLHETLDTH